MANAEARRQALEVRDRYEFEPTSLVSYRSNGKLLALGNTASLARCDELPSSIDLQRLEVDGGIEIEGYLGHFSLRRGEASWQADAILDLNSTPLLAREMLPPGYFHWPPEQDLDTDLLDDLRDLGGEFDKPKYFVYDESICAHGVNGQIACNRCIEACPAGAISSLVEKIEVDPHLCQGGGACSTVCPSGAIRYLYPTLRDQGRRLRGMLDAYREQGGEAAILLFHADSHEPGDYVEAYDSLLPLPVEELASVGPDLCLSALAYGASQVVLLVDQATPASAVSNLEAQIGWLGDVIAALGLDAACLALCKDGDEIPLLSNRRELPPAVHDVPPGKRDAIYRALDHLVAELQPAVDSVELADPAPFGSAAIDADKCTLCMACVGACPGRALQDGSNREVPEVFFIESNCLQCGACVTTCPEDAIDLTPRLLLDAEARRRSRALNRDQPFACISCGKPFAPTSVIHKMQEKLSGHHMFGNQRALDRLKMCDDCRVADIVQDPEAMGGQFDPQKGFRE